MTTEKVVGMTMPKYVRVKIFQVGVLAGKLQ
jgi:hypothetical protein